MIPTPEPADLDAVEEQAGALEPKARLVRRIRHELSRPRMDFGPAYRKLVSTATYRMHRCRS